MLRKTVLLAALSAFCAPAIASDAHLYGTIDFVRAEIRFDEVDGFRIPRQRVNGGVVALGYRLNPYVALEARLGQTRSTTAASAGDGGEQVDLRFGIDYAVGGYAKVIWPVDPGRIEPYLLIGATRVETRTAVTGEPSIRVSDTDLSYGVGTHLWANSRAGMKLEYTRYLDKSGMRVDAPHVGFIFRF